MIQNRPRMHQFWGQNCRIHGGIYGKNSRGHGGDERLSQDGLPSFLKNLTASTTLQHRPPFPQTPTAGYYHWPLQRGIWVRIRIVYYCIYCRSHCVHAVYRTLTFGYSGVFKCVYALAILVVVYTIRVLYTIRIHIDGLVAVYASKWQFYICV